jgi:hypothetical protein
VHAHRTISSLAVIAATAGVAIGGAATAQAATPHHHEHASNAKRKARYSAPLLPLLASGKATPNWKTIGPCIGAGPLARRGEFIKSTTDRREQSPRRNQLTTSATCIGVIEY